jgi:hypothetical protein
MTGNELQITGGIVPFGRQPIYVQATGLSVDAVRAAFQAVVPLSVNAVAPDTRPPNLSIDDFPTGPTAASTVGFRWLGVDETSIPSAGQQNAITYSYWLEGRDTDWSAWTPVTHVSYNLLASGDYTFRVKGRDAAGNVSLTESRPLKILARPKAPTGLHFLSNPSG